MKKRPMWALLLADMIVGFVQGFVLAHGVEANNVPAALTTAFWMWLGFVVPMEV